MIHAACSCAITPTSDELVAKLVALGLAPITTSTSIQVQYEGANRSIVDSIVALYENESTHSVSVIFRKPKTTGIYVHNQ